MQHRELVVWVDDLRRAKCGIRGREWGAADFRAHRDLLRFGGADYAVRRLQAGNRGIRAGYRSIERESQTGSLSNRTSGTVTAATGGHTGVSGYLKKERILKMNDWLLFSSRTSYFSRERVYTDVVWDSTRFVPCGTESFLNIRTGWSATIAEHDSRQSFVSPDDATLPSWILSASGETAPQKPNPIA
jgi:hypothetical protein